MISTQPPRTVISVMTILQEWRGHDSLALLDPPRLPTFPHGYTRLTLTVSGATSMEWT